jgi:hypothetical protein
MRLLCAVLAALVLLTGCTRVTAGTPSMGPVDDEWRNAVIDAVVQLGTALGPVSDAMSNDNYPALESSCRDLGAYLDTMERKVLPGPDANINSALRDGIDGYREMATLCAALSSASSPADLQRLSNAIDRADRRIKDALKLLGVEVPKR